MVDKIGLNGDIGAAYQFLDKLNIQLDGLWESESMLSKAEVSHLEEGLSKTVGKASEAQIRLAKFKQLSDLREKLNVLQT